MLERFQKNVFVYIYIICPIHCQHFQSVSVKVVNLEVPPRDCGGAYPKKPSCVPRLPVTSMPNLVRIQSGSIS